MVASALASVFLRSAVFATGAFAATMVLSALLYLAAAVLALLVVIVATTSWPVRATVNAGAGFGSTLANTYVVGLAVLVVILACAALGGGLLLAAPTTARPRGR